MHTNGILNPLIGASLLITQFVAYLLSPLNLQVGIMINWIVGSPGPLPVLFLCVSRLRGLAPIFLPIRPAAFLPTRILYQASLSKLYVHKYI